MDINVKGEGEKEKEMRQDGKEKGRLEKRLDRMTNVLRDIVMSHDLVSMQKLNLLDEDSIETLVYTLDNNLGYQESLPPDDRLFNKLDNMDQ